MSYSEETLYEALEMIASKTPLFLKGEILRCLAEKRYIEVYDHKEKIMLTNDMANGVIASMEMKDLAKRSAEISEMVESLNAYLTNRQLLEEAKRCHYEVWKKTLDAFKTQLESEKKELAAKIKKLQIVINRGKNSEIEIDQLVCVEDFFAKVSKKGHEWLNSKRKKEQTVMYHY